MAGNVTFKQWRKHNLRHRWWAVRNWLNGHSFSAVERFRCCGHTTPWHSWDCPAHGDGVPPQQRYENVEKA